MKKRYMLMTIIGLVILLAGCADNAPEEDSNTLLNDHSSDNATEEDLNTLPGDHPPEMYVEVDGEEYTLELGAYCWFNITEDMKKCVDAVTPTESFEPIEVSPGQIITLTTDYSPKPDEVTVTILENGDSTMVEMESDEIVAPQQAGTYEYVYHVNWIDHEDERYSLASASYGFILQVK